LLAGADAALEVAGKKGDYTAVPGIEAEWAGKIEEYLKQHPEAPHPEKAYLRLTGLYGSAADAGVRIKSLYERIKGPAATAPWFEAFLRLAFYQLHGKDSKTLQEILTDAELVSTLTETKAASVYFRGEAMMWAGNLKEARAFFDRIVKEFDESRFKGQALGNIHEIEHLQPGMSAPDFKVPLIAGGELTLSSLKGKVVLLLFWNHWAPLLPDRAPSLVKMLNQHKSKPFALVGVALDEPGSRETLTKSIAEYSLAFPHGFNGKGWQGPLAKQYNVQSVPRAFLIDPQGKLLDTDLFFRSNFEHLVNSAVVKRDAEIQKALAAKIKAEEDAKKKAEAAKAAAKPPAKK
jgi:peroxiredoxin